jgi:hypothetical protein
MGYDSRNPYPGAPMLDVHPPHAPTHTWKDFFLHIATITVGLLIAVSLEQTVELFHRHHQREQLREDLNHEAEVRIPRIHENFKIFMADLAWYEQILQAGRAAKLEHGVLTLILPPRPATLARIRPADSVWPSAKASGLVAVLPQSEIEVWSRVDQVGQAVLEDGRLETHTANDLGAITDRLGIDLVAGATLRLPPADCDELLRAIALLRANYAAFAIRDATWAGASNAALHGARTAEALEPYEAQAQIDMRH